MVQKTITVCKSMARREYKNDLAIKARTMKYTALAALAEKAETLQQKNEQEMAKPKPDLQLVARRDKIIEAIYGTLASEAVRQSR